jgi:hypothetical protein
MKKLYIVTEGIPTKISEEIPRYDHNESVIVYACDEIGAIELSKKYDAGLISYENLFHNGRNVVAVYEE